MSDSHENEHTAAGPVESPGMMEQRPSTQNFIGRKIHHYEIVSELGRGGMATVYLAKQANMNRQVAIKVLPPEFLHDPQFYQRFEREVETIARLEHPHILPVYDFGEDGGVPYIVMRYLGGGSMRDWLRRVNPTPEDLVRPIEQVCSALEFAHAEGIIHRDLKPPNIMLDERGNAYLSDFGIAQIMQDAGRLTGSAVIGTPAYMSPEQAEGKPLDARSDIYAMGVVMFELLTGREPYQADTPMAVLLKHITEPMPFPRQFKPELSVAVQEVVMRATEKDPSKRYASAGELSRAFADAVREVPTAPAEPVPEVEYMATVVGIDDAAVASTAAGVATGAGQKVEQPTAAARPAAGTVPGAPSGAARTAPAAQTQAQAAAPAGGRRGLWIALAVIAVLVVGGGALLLGSGALNPAPVIVANTTTAAPGSAPTPVPPTPFSGANVYRGPNDLYQVSVPSDWQRQDRSTADELFVLWFADADAAMTTIRVLNTGGRSAGQVDAAVREHTSEHYADEHLFSFIDSQEQDDGSIRYSYRVPQPGALYEQFGRGQLDVFYYQRGPYFLVLEVFITDEAEEANVLPVMQNVLQSLYLDENAAWG